MLANRPTNDLSFPSRLEEAGQAANQAAARGVFTDYAERKAQNTDRRQRVDLATFEQFLAEVGAACGDLREDPQAWRGVTWGLVAAFQRWQLGQGYAVSSVNVRLSTVKSYAKLAMKAGVIPAAEYAMIRAVEGYQHKEAPRIDETRAAAGQQTRRGAKKAQAVSIAPAQARALKGQPDTPQGRRDALIMVLLLDHGLRVGELALLTVDSFDLASGEFRFYRPKVDKVQTHKMTTATRAALIAYLDHDAPAVGCIWRQSTKSGELGAQGMTERALTDRVRTMGAAVGLAGLSAHDCRHYWATAAVRNGTALDRLQDAGGWASLSMPLRYAEAARIANQGVNLGAD